MISLEHWEKAKLIISSIWEQVKTEGSICFKSLESLRGFLIYMSRTYPTMVPYLKGIHQTLDSWHPYGREVGWKLRYQDIERLHKNLETTAVESANDYDSQPDRVKNVEQLKGGLEALD